MYCTCIVQSDSLFETTEKLHSSTRAYNFVGITGVYRAYLSKILGGQTSGVPSKSAARRGDLKCRPIIYNSIRPTVIVGPYIKFKKSETVEFTIY